MALNRREPRVLDLSGKPKEGEDLKEKAIDSPSISATAAEPPAGLTQEPVKDKSADDVSFHISRNLAVPPAGIDQASSLSIINALVGERSVAVGTTLPPSLFDEVENYRARGGARVFFEEAIAKFEGDIVALIPHMVAFQGIRKTEGSPRTTSARINCDVYKKFDAFMTAALELKVKRISQSMLLGGFVVAYSQMLAAQQANGPK